MDFEKSSVIHDAMLDTIAKENPGGRFWIKADWCDVSRSESSKKKNRISAHAICTLPQNPKQWKCTTKKDEEDSMDRRPPSIFKPICIQQSVYF
eukprot:gene3919-15244_t